MGSLSMDELKKLQRWYRDQCNGDWEHQRGVKIETLDNPGWLVKVDLLGTQLQDVSFIPLTEGDENEARPDCSWLRCFVKDRVFLGAGDPHRLGPVKVKLDTGKAVRNDEGWK
jgi:hypothetical protein